MPKSQRGQSIAEDHGAEDRDGGDALELEIPEKLQKMMEGKRMVLVEVPRNV